MAIGIRELTDPADPDVSRLAQLMLATFADANIVLSEERLKEFTGRVEADRSFHVLVARDGDGVVGGVVFSFVVPSLCGFSEYLVVHRDYRRQGIGRLLVEARKELLDRRAREHGAPGARGVFIEVENPERTPPAFLERERETAVDAWDRWRIFHRLGFLRVDVAYVQPPLGPDKRPVDYMDLLFCPWDEGVRRSRRVPAEWILHTVRPIWRGWVPDRYQEFLASFRVRLGDGLVPLVPLFPEPASGAG